MTNLKRCPCGEVPDEIILIMSSLDSPWRYAMPSCCKKWNIPFKPSGLLGKQNEVNNAWNDAPRGGE